MAANVFRTASPAPFKALTGQLLTTLGLDDTHNTHQLCMFSEFRSLTQGDGLHCGFKKG